MNLREFREIINKIPTLYDNVKVSFIAESKEFLVKNYDDIEWYQDDMDNNALKIDITLRR